MARKKLKDVIEDLALPKDTVITIYDRDMAREKIWQVAMSRPVTIMEWFYGVGIIDQPEPEPEQKKPTKPKRKTHVSKGPDPYRGQHRDDGRGNRTGEPIRKKLTVDQVKEIKKIIDTTKRANKDLAREFGVSRETISHIRRGIRWAEV